VIATVIVITMQCDQKIGYKITQILEKVAKMVAESKNAKIAALKYTLKVLNIHIKPLLDP
jgi:hypothetical protein